MINDSTIQSQISVESDVLGLGNPDSYFLSGDSLGATLQPTKLLSNQLSLTDFEIYESEFNSTSIIQQISQSSEKRTNEINLLGNEKEHRLTKSSRSDVLLNAFTINRKQFSGSINKNKKGTRANDFLDALDGEGASNKKVKLRGRAGDDIIVLGENLIALGNSGNDSLDSRSGRRNTLNGGSGNDTLYPGLEDTMNGGGGRDRFVITRKTRKSRIQKFDVENDIVEIWNERIRNLKNIKLKKNGDDAGSTDIRKGRKTLITIEGQSKRELRRSGFNYRNRFTFPELSIEPKLNEISGLNNVTEGGKAEFTVRLDNSFIEPISVSYGTLVNESTATSGKDFKRQDGILRFEQGEVEKLIQIETIDDEFPEETESLFVQLNDVQINDAIIQDITFDPKKTSQNVLDNELPSRSIPRIVISSDGLQDINGQKMLSITEGQSGNKIINFDIGLSSPSEESITVNYNVRDASAKRSDDDYQISDSEGEFILRTGQKESERISIAINGDTRFEPNEKFNIVFTSSLEDDRGIEFQAIAVEILTDEKKPVTRRRRGSKSSGTSANEDGDFVEDISFSLLVDDAGGLIDDSTLDDSTIGRFEGVISDFTADNGKAVFEAGNLIAEYDGSTISYSLIDNAIGKFRLGVVLLDLSEVDVEDAVNSLAYIWENNLLEVSQEDQNKGRKGIFSDLDSSEAVTIDVQEQEVDYFRRQEDSNGKLLLSTEFIVARDSIGSTTDSNDNINIGEFNEVIEKFRNIDTTNDVRDTFDSGGILIAQKENGSVTYTILNSSRRKLLEGTVETNDEIDAVLAVNDFDFILDENLLQQAFFPAEL